MGIDTRNKIIEASARLFNMRGYHGCSLQDIMDATKLKKGGIYNYFNNKDEIAFAAFDYSFNEVLSRFKTALARASTSREKLYAILEVFGSFYKDPVSEGGCPVFNTAVDSNGTHPELTEKAREAINTLKRYIEIKIDEGKESGEFKPEVKSEELSSLIILTTEGALIMSRVNNDPAPVATAIKHLKNTINNSILTHKTNQLVANEKE
jgi:TetR/AcrR family transcriptional regulator, transcriptional repressor for nem operon